MKSDKILNILTDLANRKGLEIVVTENNWQTWYKVVCSETHIIETMVRKATPTVVEFVTYGSILSSTPRFFETVKGFKQFAEAYND